ncbi:MAG: flippase-like domain-containing protein [Chitinispirillales bacterium]|jgi:uncharacterized membrane protein YbhN (UPF0104 family)|nr:flippase-like domain-containing protein [Chitinispirillales bacterium]
MKILKYVIGLLLAAVGLYIFFRGSGGGESVCRALAEEISRSGPIGAVVCAGLALLSIWLRALRLRVILPDTLPLPPLGIAATALDAAAIRPTPHKGGLFSVTMVMAMLNNVLPVRAGEAARVALLWKRNGFPVMVCVGSLLVEHALDIAAYLSFLFIPPILSPEILVKLRGLHPAMIVVIWLSAAAFASLLGLFSLYALLPRIFRGAAARIGRRLPSKIKSAAARFGAEMESNVDWVAAPGKAARVAALTCAITLCYSLMLFILVCDITFSGFMNSLFSQAFAAFGAAIPLAPGSVGTLHAVLLQGMTITGCPAQKARAVIIVYHAVQYVVITGAGLLCVLGMKSKICRWGRS